MRTHSLLFALALSLLPLGGCFDPKEDDTGAADTADTSGIDSAETDTDTGPVVIVPPPGSPVVVVWVIDTLGELASEEIGYCTQFQELAATYDMDVDCRAGGVAPSSWTVESTQRIAWPEMNQGALRASVQPPCEGEASFATIAHALDGKYVFGYDNAQLDEPFQRPYCDGDATSGWENGADAFFVMSGDIDYVDQIEMDENSRAARVGLEQAIEWSEEGKVTFAYLNNFEGGGHSPRCFEDPYSAACDTTWTYMVSKGLVAESDNRYERFVDIELWADLFNQARVETEIPEADVQTLFWDTMLESGVDFRDSLVLPRLDRLLSALKEQGRLDDLQLVMLGDHGESPCATELVREGRDCSHGAEPNNWTTRVPAFFFPASMGQRWEANGWVGDLDVPWSTTVIPYALADDYKVDRPTSWPEPEPLGTGTSLTCFEGLSLQHRYGLRVKGNQSLHCSTARCGGFDWQPFTDEHDVPAPIATESLDPDLSVLLDTYGNDANWFIAACDGQVED